MVAVASSPLWITPFTIVIFFMVNRAAAAAAAAAKSSAKMRAGGADQKGETRPCEGRHSSKKSVTNLSIFREKSVTNLDF